MAALIIRDGTAYDVPYLLHLVNAVDPSGGLDGITDWWLHWAIFSDEMVVLVAEDCEHHRLVGLAAMNIDPDGTANLLSQVNLMVHPDYEMQAVERRLLQNALERAELGQHVLLLEASTRSLGMQRMALEFGFVPVGIVPRPVGGARWRAHVLFARYFGDALSRREPPPPLIRPILELAELTETLGQQQFSEDLTPDWRSSPLPRDMMVREANRREILSSRCLSIDRFKPAFTYGFCGAYRGILGHVFPAASCFVAEDVAQVDPARTLEGLLEAWCNENQHVLQIGCLRAVSENVARALLETVLLRLEDPLRGAISVQVDVAVEARSIIKTLLALNFVPTGFLRAFGLHGHLRRDAVRMIRFFSQIDLEPTRVVPTCYALHERVLASWTSSANSMNIPNDGGAPAPNDPPTSFNRRVRDGIRFPSPQLLVQPSVANP